MNTPSPVIQKLQNLLMARGYKLPRWGADGLGGHETQAAILAFQRDNNLAPSGQFDALTLAKLNPPSSSAWHLTETEIAIALALLSHFPGIPPIIRSFLMWPTLLKILSAILPDVAEEATVVEKEFTELASNESGEQKLRSIVAFAKVIVAEGEKILDAVDAPATGATK